MAAILDQYGKPMPSLTAQRARARTARLLARYDAAQTNTDNERHWANADGLSAAAANNPAVRRTLRNRSRYECHESNPLAKGIVLTVANDTIGTGPKPQILSTDKAANRLTEQLFWGWCKEINLPARLRTARMSELVDGEIFLQAITNYHLRGPVKLDIRNIEADQVASPNMFAPEMGKVDGIDFDRWGNPQTYHVLKVHPGADYWATNGTEADSVSAEDMIHLYRCDRPGQCRGVPEVTTALPLFAELRRFTAAVVAAAETAAELAGVMHTQEPPEDSDDLEAPDPGEAIPLELRSLLVLPDGYAAEQMKAEHPTTTYEMFVNAILNQIARCLNMPFNIAAANSAKYNFASGRLDHKLYFKSVGVVRGDWEIACLDRIFRWWLAEAVLLPQFLPEAIRDAFFLYGEVPHEWRWPGEEMAVDPLKEAAARETDLGCGAITFQTIFGERGLDWESEQEKSAAALGLTIEEYRRRLADKLLGPKAPAQKSKDTAAAEEEVASAS